MKQSAAERFLKEIKKAMKRNYRDTLSEAIKEGIARKRKEKR